MEMETYNFTLFKQGPVERTIERIYVTIDRRCRIFFNRTAHEALGKPAGVALMFDETKQVIGVIPSDTSKKETYRLKTIGGRSGGKVIAALNFCRCCSITPKETFAFQNPRVNHDGILILSLHHVQTVMRRERKRSKEK
jgi:hypothetical protein